MLPTTSLFRTARVLFPSILRQAPTTTSARTFTHLTTSPQTLRRPTLRLTQQNGGIGAQIRGMKVRSSVKKLCEGCKVCSFPRIAEDGIESGGRKRGRGVERWK